MARKGESFFAHSIPVRTITQIRPEMIGEVTFIQKASTGQGSVSTYTWFWCTPHLLIMPLTVAYNCDIGGIPE